MGVRIVLKRALDSIQTTILTHLVTYKSYLHQFKKNLSQPHSCYFVHFI
jgi:hypothetical protein